MKKVLSIFCVIVIFIFSFSSTACAKELSLSAQAYVLYCVENGEVLLHKNADEKKKPASTTKIMTTLLALEACEKNDPIVEFTEEMIAEGSSMYLKVGDTVHLSDLAVGMMMASGNDAANATAVTISKDVESFSELMNKRAKEIGMSNTNFVTPSGLDDENHYSTATDIALLMGEAVKNERFCEITKNEAMTVNFLTPQKKVTYQNHNRLLKLYDYCIGGKTGFTKSAGRCLVSVSRKDGVTLVCVTLDAPSDWNDHIAMYNYGFEQLSSVDTDDTKEEFTADIVGADKDTISLYCKDFQKAVVKKEDVNKVKRTVFIPSFLYAPVKVDDYAGDVVYTLDGKVIAQNPLYVRDNTDRVEKSSFEIFFDRIFK